MKTKIISAFPGTGKTYYASNIKRTAKVVDLDTYRYTLGYTDDGKARNKDFPNNYLIAVKKHLGETDILFVGCQPEVITSLRDAGLSFTIVYPERALKDEYVKRYRQRHNHGSFINLLSKNWNFLLDFLEKQENCKHIVLGSGQYIGDIVNSI